MNPALVKESDTPHRAGYQVQGGCQSNPQGLWLQRLRNSPGHRRKARADDRKSMASPSELAMLLITKYVDGLPLHCGEPNRGYVMTDDYAGYNALGAQSGVERLGCRAPERWKFVEAQKSPTLGQNRLRRYCTRSSICFPSRPLQFQSLLLLRSPVFGQYDKFQGGAHSALRRMVCQCFLKP